MRFKHTFHVFVDNFPVIYKQLIYRLIILAVSSAITVAVVYPFIMDLMNSPQLKHLIDSSLDYALKLLNGDVAELKDLFENIKTAYGAFIVLLQTKFTRFILSCLLLLLVFIVSKWFESLGNYATAAILNDKMALRANQPFLTTLIRNLKDASIYSLIYVPLSILYDIIVAVAMFVLLFFLLNNVLNMFISLFLFVLVIVVSVVIKMTFTTDWLPAIIRGKKGHGGAFKYTFLRKGKSTLSVMSDFAVLVLLVFALNVAAFFTTFGVGLLLTIPSSYVAILCYEFVNYYDRECLKYFIDKDTIISGTKERTQTREEFFRGNNGENN